MSQGFELFYKNGHFLTLLTLLLERFREMCFIKSLMPFHYFLDTCDFRCSKLKLGQIAPFPNANGVDADSICAGVRIQYFPPMSFHVSRVVSRVVLRVNLWIG